MTLLTFFLCIERTFKRAITQLNQRKFTFDYIVENKNLWSPFKKNAQHLFVYNPLNILLKYLYFDNIKEKTIGMSTSRSLNRIYRDHNSTTYIFLHFHNERNMKTFFYDVLTTDLELIFKTRSDAVHLANRAHCLLRIH